MTLLETTRTDPAVILDGLITREQLAAQLDKTTRCIQNYEANGLPVIRRGRMRLYDVHAVRAWLRGELPKRRGRPSGARRGAA